MADIQHSSITGADAAHPFFVVSESDPGAIGAYKGWFKASTGELKVRNAANNGWLDITITGTSTALSDHLADTSDAHDASAISVLDTAAQYTATNVEAALAEVLDALQAHQADTTDAHEASAITFDPAGTIAATDVQGAIEELATEGGGGGSGHTIQEEGSAMTARTNLNFTGAGVTVSDDAANDQTDVTIPGGTTDAASETVAGIAEIATQAEVNAGTDNTRIVSPQGLAGRTATETRSGILEVATQTETNTGTDDATIVTPAKLAGRTSTETRTGVIELATQAETNTGTDDTRAVTPLKLKTNVDLHINDTTDAHDASAISIADSAAQYTATDVEGALAEVLDGLQAHEADTTDAHDASAISFSPAGSIAATNVQAALEEVASEAGGGGSAHTIKDEGSAMTQRANLNFIGAGVTVTDDAGNSETEVTIPGGGNITGAYDIESGSYSDAGMSDEFASGTLDAKWTASVSSGTIDFPGQPASSCYDLTSRPGTLLLQPAYSTSTFQDITLRQADSLASGESLVLSCALPHQAKGTSNNYTLLGFYLNSSTTSYNTGTWNAFRILVNASGIGSSAALVQMITDGGSQRIYPIDNVVDGRCYLRVSRKTVNSIDSFVWLFSTDGVVWTLVWQSTAISHTHMWILSQTNTHTNPAISPVYPINWVRHVAATAHDLW